jgi:hypothetical protein
MQAIKERRKAEMCRANCGNQGIQTSNNRPRLLLGKAQAKDPVTQKKRMQVFRGCEQKRHSV